MKKQFFLIAMALTSSFAMADIPTVSVYADCSKNGYSMGIADVLSTSGRTSCGYVQLWAGGPKWATFNVGATITDYAQLTVGADPTSFFNYNDQAPYYNTANVGGLYAWNNPNINSRKTTWTSSVSTGISDVATTLWGSNWKTPTKAQLDTLQNSTYGKTTWTWCDGSTTQYVAGCTLKGYKVSGVGDYANYSIFLPAAGFFIYYYGSVLEASYGGFYWSSTEDGSDYAYDLYFNLGHRYINTGYRKDGQSVRAVLDNNSGIIKSANNVTLILYADGCSAPNVITCPKGQQLRINAVDMYGYHFAQWTDGNTTNPRVVTMNSNATYTAQFAKNLYTITTAANDSDRGVVLGDTTVEYLETISISATPNYGYHFTRWNDGNTDNPRQVQVTGDKTYTAQFDKNAYSITKTAIHGSVSGPSSSMYLDIVSLTANPNYGYHFVQWSDGNTDNPRSFVLTQDTSFIAFFDRDTFLISTQSAQPDWGYTIGDTDALYLDSVTLEAIPYYGYEFVRWSDWNYNNPRKEVVDKDKSYTAEFKKRRFSISTMSINGHIEGVPYYAEYLDEVTLTATPSYGYHFEKWSDGNIENPRTFTITQDTTFSAIFALNYSGKCGDNLYWQYQNDTLTITGNNAMYDEQQWVRFIDSISVVSLPEGCTYIGEGVFRNMEGLSELTIPTSVTEIGENAFDGCRYLFDVYCYSELPPVAHKSSFYNFNVYLHVPCECLKAYQTDAIFGSFKNIQCAVAEDVLVDTLTIIPNSTDAIFMWPMNEYAATYVIEIINDGKVYCTLTFNSAGQLLNIAFAPGRNSNYENAAQLTANGFMFSVTGLKQGSDYAFSFVVKNEEEQPIQTINGEFQTKGTPTDLEETSFPLWEDQGEASKIIKDGQLYILRDGKTYNAQGGEVR